MTEFKYRKPFDSKGGLTVEKRLENDTPVEGILMRGANLLITFAKPLYFIHFFENRGRVDAALPHTSIHTGTGIMLNSDNNERHIHFHETGLTGDFIIKMDNLLG